MPLLRPKPDRKTTSTTLMIAPAAMKYGSKAIRLYPANVLVNTSAAVTLFAADP